MRQHVLYISQASTDIHIGMHDLEKGRKRGDLSKRGSCTIMLALCAEPVQHVHLHRQA